HLMLVDLTPFGITGRDAEKWLDAANITVNKNGIPFDTKSPFVTSGIRVGTPAVTTRGMGVKEMQTIAGFIVDVLKSKGDDKTIARVKSAVLDLTKQFPLP
ncbi:MAG TPA: serine hydroxymethyltransferase, partial [Spirochaetales bacterium]|nr:serine hydroxymethyltransferase [Spirochaetales bacterium]